MKIKLAVLAALLLAIMFIAMQKYRLYENFHAWQDDRHFSEELLADEQSADSVGVMQIYSVKDGRRDYSLEKLREMPLIGELRDKNAVSVFFASLRHGKKSSSGCEDDGRPLNILAFDPDSMRYAYFHYDICTKDGKMSGMIVLPGGKEYLENPELPEFMKKSLRKAAQ